MWQTVQLQNQQKLYTVYKFVMDMVHFNLQIHISINSNTATLSSFHIIQSAFPNKLPKFNLKAI